MEFCTHCGEPIMEVGYTYTNEGFCSDDCKQQSEEPSGGEYLIFDATHDELDDDLK